MTELHERVTKINNRMTRERADEFPFFRLGRENLQAAETVEEDCQGAKVCVPAKRYLALRGELGRGVCKAGLVARG